MPNKAWNRRALILPEPLPQGGDSNPGGSQTHATVEATRVRANTTVGSPTVDAQQVAHAGVVYNNSGADPRPVFDDYGADGLKVITFNIDWQEHETADDTFSTTKENLVRSYLQDAVDNDYALMFRIRCGAQSPQWLYDSNIGVRRVFTMEDDGGSTTKMFSIPDPADTKYRTRYQRMLERWATIFNETHNGKALWTAIAKIPAALPCTVGSEMTIGMGGSSDADLYSDKRGLSSSIEATTTSLTMDASKPSAWTAGQSVVKLGGNVAFARRRFWDDCQRSPVPASGWGQNRVGHAWTLNGAAANFLSDSGTALKMVFTANTSNTRRAHIFPTDAELKDKDADHLVKFKFTAVNTAGTLNFGLEGRSQTSNLHGYRARIQRAANGNVTLNFQRIETDGSNTNLADGAAAVESIAANVEHYFRMQIIAEGSDVRIRAKWWAVSETEPAGWTTGNRILTYLDNHANKHTTAGGYGIYANQTNTVDVASNPLILDYRVGDHTGAEYVLVSSISGSTVNVQRRGWSGTHPVAHASGANNIEQAKTDADDGDLTTPTAGTYEGISAPVDRRHVNIGGWRELYPPAASESDSGANGPSNRRTVYKDGWVWCINTHMSVFREEIPCSIAMGTIWLDDGVTAFDILATQELIDYGTRWWVGYTNVSAGPGSDDGWTVPRHPAKFVMDAEAQGNSTWGQNKGPGGFPNGPLVMEAFENFLHYCPTSFRLIEVAPQRFSDAGTYDLYPHHGWQHTVSITLRSWLLTHADALNKRMRAVFGL